MNYEFKDNGFKLFKILSPKNSHKIILLSIIINLFFVNFVFSFLLTTYHLSLTTNKWWVHHTDHYLIKTNTSKKFAIKLGKKLEKIVYAYEKILGYDALRNEKFTVVVYNDKTYFNEYLKNEYNTTAKTAMYLYTNKNQEIKKEIVAFYILDERDFFRNLYRVGAQQYLKASIKNIPPWLYEGIGELFEYWSVNKKGVTIFLQNTYWFYYLKSIIKNKNLSMQKIITMQHNDFYSSNEAENFAQSWAILFSFFKQQTKKKVIWNYIDVLDNKYNEADNISYGYKVLNKYGINKLDNFYRNYWNGYFFKHKII